MSARGMTYRDTVAKGARLGMQALVVRTKGEVKDIWHAEGFAPGARFNQRSVAKAFTATAIALAIEDGMLDMSMTIADLFPRRARQLNTHEQPAKLFDLLNMVAGFSEPRLMSTERARVARDRTVMLDYALAVPRPFRPGGHFVYTNVGHYLAAAALCARAGEPLDAYLKPRLFEPLGFGEVLWETDEAGNTFGASDLYIATEDLAKFGEVYLQEGEFGGAKVLPKEWVDACRRKQVDSDTDYGYSFGFWHGPRGTYYASGVEGQFCLIDPAREMVLAANGKAEEPFALLKILYDTEKFFR